MAPAFFEPEGKAMDFFMPSGNSECVQMVTFTIFIGNGKAFDKKIRYRQLKMSRGRLRPLWAIRG
jgi:hypothetical protein